MRIERIVLTDFRNYEHFDWSPGAPICVLTGDNGAGKTNLLEAISLLAPGRGLRAAPLARLQRQDTQGAWAVAAWLDSGNGIFQLGTGSDPRGGARRIFVHEGVPVRSQAVVAEEFSCVWITPQMDRLFSESGSGRRRFLDRLVVALDPQHVRQSAAHDRAMSQRARVLIERPREEAWLEALENSAARHAIAVTAARMMLVEALNGIEPEDDAFPRCLATLECPIASDLAVMPALASEERLRERLRQSRAADRARGSARHGAHRTDLLLSDLKTGRPAALSSSGQQKAMLVALILAHARVISLRRDVAPVLLLDEVLVHLDLRKRTALLDSLKKTGSSVFLTGTDPEAFLALRGNADCLRLSQGKIDRNIF